MHRTPTHNILAWWPSWKSSLWVAVASAVIFGTAVPVAPSAARLGGDETKSPIEEEKERESEEESLSTSAGGQHRQRQRQRMKSNRSTRPEKLAPSTADRRRSGRAGCCDGHCLSNGLPAPLVC